MWLGSQALLKKHEALMSDLSAYGSSIQALREQAQSCRVSEALPPEGAWWGLGGTWQDLLKDTRELTLLNWVLLAASERKSVSVHLVNLVQPWGLGSVMCFRDML